MFIFYCDKCGMRTSEEESLLNGGSRVCAKCAAEANPKVITVLPAPLIRPSGRIASTNAKVQKASIPPWSLVGAVISVFVILAVLWAHGHNSGSEITIERRDAPRDEPVLAAASFPPAATPPAPAPSALPSDSSGAEWTRKREAHAAQMLEEYKTWFKSHPCATDFYREKLTKLAAAYQSTPQATEAQQILCQLPKPLAANAMGEQLGRWAPEQMSQTLKISDWDASRCLHGDGKYELTLRYEHGSHRIEVKWVALLENGIEVARDTHDGVAGAVHRNNIYRFTAPEGKPGAAYAVRVQLRSDGGTDSFGAIWLKMVE